MQENRLPQWWNPIEGWLLQIMGLLLLILIMKWKVTYTTMKIKVEYIYLIKFQLVLAVNYNTYNILLLTNQNLIFLICYTWNNLPCIIFIFFFFELDDIYFPSLLLFICSNTGGKLSHLSIPINWSVFTYNLLIISILFGYSWSFGIDYYSICFIFW
jgi:hypothetical protein